MIFNGLVFLSAVAFSLISIDILKLVWKRHRFPKYPQAVAEWSVLFVFLSIAFTTYYLSWNIVFHKYEPTNMGISYPIWIIRSLAGIFCWLAVKNAQTHVLDPVMRLFERGRK